MLARIATMSLVPMAAGIEKWASSTSPTATAQSRSASMQVGKKTKGLEKLTILYWYCTHNQRSDVYRNRAPLLVQPPLPIKRRAFVLVVAAGDGTHPLEALLELGCFGLAEQEGGRRGEHMRMGRRICAGAAGGSAWWARARMHSAIIRRGCHL